MNLLTKKELTEQIRSICESGWHQSVKKTKDTRNDGAVGNTLETLLGIKENNLPIPNAREWELKGQRSRTKSLITLKHIDPSPRALGIVPHLLLPFYGWRHKKAGKKYPDTEMSFRSTTSATQYTKRGFRIIVDRGQEKVKFVFDASKANKNDPVVARWLENVKERIGLGPFETDPYWGFEDLRYAIGEKIKNCFYVVADSKVDEKKEYFHYIQLHILSGFSFDKFLSCVESGIVLVDFDARTGHNHGTKFRIKQDSWLSLYSYVQRII